MMNKDERDLLDIVLAKKIKVNRNRTPQEAITAVKCLGYYLEKKVVNSVPRGEGEEVEICFFPIKGSVSVAEVQEMLDVRGLKPDPYALAAFNEDDPSISGFHPTATQWLDNNGNHCYLSFSGNRDVFCGYSEDNWDGGDWENELLMSGVRKPKS